MTTSTRREVLGAIAVAPLSGSAVARTLTEEMPWQPNDASPPPTLVDDGWHFFTANEAASIDAIVERLIPTDERGPGGKDAGCTFFIDRQLAGPYGENAGLYTQGPHPEHPLPSQGLQTALTPRDQYRQGLAALEAYTKDKFGGKRFENLSPAEQDKLLEGLEKGEIALPGFNGKMFFEAVLKNTMEGFFADPIYGGNRNMVGWKLVGFPGTRYDYRDVIANPNKPYTLPPVSIHGRAAWNEKP
jgi:gluconate 2-dehydrogenase gamma chain